MNSKIKTKRIPIELMHIKENHSKHGITCTADDDYTQLLAHIPGPRGSPYEAAKLKVSISIGPHYPFQPPIFKFVTPVYHPNIEDSGKICLDMLRMPPSGSYNPAITLESILLSIQLLLATPNPDDPLNGDAADLYKTNRTQYEIKAREELRKHCTLPADEDSQPVEAPVASKNVPTSD